MKSPTTIFGLVAACGLALSAGAGFFDPNETLPNWIWPLCKMITAVGVAGAGYYAQDWKQPQPKPPVDSDPKTGV